MDLSEALKDKVLSAFQNESLVGNVSYSEDEYEELLAYTKYYSRKYAFGGEAFLYGDDEIIFTTLVEIAKKWKNDDDSDKGFWKHIFWVILNVDDNQRLWNAFKDLIVALEFHNKILIASTYNKYYATILMHAMAPYKSMSAFFDFAYNIFKKDLDFDYTDADRWICNTATEKFCSVVKNIGGPNIDVHIGSGVYGIKIGLRSMALGNETRERFIDLLDRVLHAINSLYHGNELKDDTYLVDLVMDWWETKAEKDVKPTDKTYIRPTPKQNITAKFVRREEKVFLCVPPIRFASGENPQLWLSIYIDGADKPIESKEIFTRRGEIIVTSEQQDIELNRLLRGTPNINLRVEITENRKDIFNKTIEKDFILFDNDKEIIGRVLKTGNYFVYTKAIDELQVPIAIHMISKNLYNVYPTEGEILCSSQRQVIFTNESDSAIANNKVRLVGDSGICKWAYRETTCKVFGGRINLFVPQSFSVNGLELRVSDKNILLSTLVPIPEDGYSIFDITDLIPQGVAVELILYSYLKEKELIHTNIVSVQRLRISFSKAVYFGDDDRKVAVSVGMYSRELTWELGDDIVSCHLYKGQLDITVPQFKWRIDIGEWHYGPLNEVIWYKDYFDSGSVLEVQSPLDVNTIKLYCVGDGEIQEIPQNISNRFEIGKYIYANEGRKVLALFFKSIESADRKEICMATTVERFVKEPPFVVDNNALRFIGDESFIGAKKTYFNIVFNRIGRDEIKLKSSELIDGILPDIDEGIYWVKISVPSGGLFGGGEKVLWEGEFIFGDEDKIRLSNIVLKINPICGIGTSDFWKTSVGGYYISGLVRSDNPDTYSAKIWYNNSRGERSDVCGFSKCKIEIISPIALRVLVCNVNGDYVERLRCDSSGNLYSPQSQQQFIATNYHFVEVKNV